MDWHIPRRSSAHPWWYSVVVSISGCDPLDPGSNPGTAKQFFCVCFFSFCFVSLFYIHRTCVEVLDTPCVHMEHTHGVVI